MPSIQTVLASGGTSPKDFTLHDEGHSFRVAERMRHALAFVHLSRYEGNSIVCNEAMAMNLPCLFTKVGLMLDTDQRFGVEQVEVSVALAGGTPLIETTERFLAAARARTFGPRAWVTEHAGVEQTRRSWAAVLQKFDAHH